MSPVVQRDFLEANAGGYMSANFGQYQAVSKFLSKSQLLSPYPALIVRDFVPAKNINEHDVASYADFFQDTNLAVTNFCKEQSTEHDIKPTPLEFSEVTTGCTTKKRTGLVVASLVLRGQLDCGFKARPYGSHEEITQPTVADVYPSSLKYAYNPLEAGDLVIMMANTACLARPTKPHTLVANFSTRFQPAMAVK